MEHSMLPEAFGGLKNVSEPLPWPPPLLQEGLVRSDRVFACFGSRRLSSTFNLLSEYLNLNQKFGSVAPHGWRLVLIFSDYWGMIPARSSLITNSLQKDPDTCFNAARHLRRAVFRNCVLYAGHDASSRVHITLPNPGFPAKRLDRHSIVALVPHIGQSYLCSARDDTASELGEHLQAIEWRFSVWAQRQKCQGGPCWVLPTFLHVAGQFAGALTDFRQVKGQINHHSSTRFRDPQLQKYSATHITLFIMQQFQKSVLPIAIVDDSGKGKFRLILGRVAPLAVPSVQTPDSELPGLPDPRMANEISSLLCSRIMYEHTKSAQIHVWQVFS
ncbi:hypothetical protein B0H13DRAFT_1856273 [Mycena leptocephala]|nr:hypothetical protein B0H13DRAFT_1856273 [Mycena leptocephala]